MWNNRMKREILSTHTREQLTIWVENIVYRIEKSIILLPIELAQGTMGRWSQIEGGYHGISGINHRRKKCCN